MSMKEYAPPHTDSISQCHSCISYTFQTAFQILIGSHSFGLLTTPGALKVQEKQPQVPSSQCLKGLTVWFTLPEGYFCNPRVDKELT